MAFAAGLSEHQDVLDVILDDRIGLVRLAEKGRAVVNLEGGVGDLVPDDCREVVEPQLVAPVGNRRMERNDLMLTVGLA